MISSDVFVARGRKVLGGNGARRGIHGLNSVYIDR